MQEITSVKELNTKNDNRILLITVKEEKINSIVIDTIVCC